MINIPKLPPFKRFCITIGAIPATYIESLSYYETLLWLCKYLQDTVIPAINTNAEAVTELQTAFETLQSYVDNYFENLDVQEEINNKLDEMAESGELEDIIAEYLNTKALLVFDTVADMKLSENLINGSNAKTLGYHSINDGGAATYKIREITNEDVVDEASIIAIGSDNLVAELICEEINLITFGCYGDGTHDDTNNFKKAINYGLSTYKKLISPANKTYLVNESLKPRYLNMDLNRSTIKTNSAIDIFVFDIIEALNTIENMIIDCNNIATSGMNFLAGIDGKIRTIRIINVKQYGIILDYESNPNYNNETTHAWEIMFDTIRINSEDTNINTIGILLNTSDCYFNNIIMQGIYTNFKATLPTSADITNVHCWNMSNTISKDAVMFDTYEDVRWQMKNITCDGIHTFFKLNKNNTQSQPFVKIDGLFVLYAEEEYNSTNNFTDSIIIDVPYTSNTPRISIQNGTIQGLHYDVTGLHTNLLPNSNMVFLGIFAGTTYTNVENIGRNQELTLINNAIVAADNKIVYKDNGIVNLNLNLKYPSTLFNQQYLEVATIPEAFLPNKRIATYGIVEETLGDSMTGNVADCYIDHTNGKIKISTPKAGSNPDYNYFKLLITYVKDN